MPRGIRGFITFPEVNAKERLDFDLAFRNFNPNGTLQIILRDI